MKKIICAMICMFAVLFFSPVSYGSKESKLQFLEIYNMWDSDAYVYYVSSDTDHKKVKPLADRPAWIERQIPLCQVGPGQRKRIPGILEPGFRSILVVPGPNPTAQANKSVLTSRFQVNNHGEETFLYGKHLTISRYVEGGYNIEAVQFLHGRWQFFTEAQGGADIVMMQVSHPIGTEAFTGNFGFGGQNVKFKGTMQGRNFTLNITEQGQTITAKLEIIGENWVGIAGIAGEQQGLIKLKAVYEDKLLYWIEVKDKEQSEK
jgi:hypothetical protein